MKKILAILFIIATVLGLSACGTINDTDVAILWSDAGQVKVPHSLINAFERAMYTKSIAYTHYGANGDAARQVTQAKEALNADCAALLVNLVDPATAQEIVDLAKTKDVPVVFFACDVDEAVVESYDKCVTVNTDVSTLAKTMSGMIVTYIEENTETIDRNGDGKISYVLFGSETTPDFITELNSDLSQKNLPTVEFYDSANEGKLVPVAEAKAQMKSILESYTDEGRNTVELILSDSDVATMDILVELQNKGFNRDKLTTHLIPVYTIGYEADYKEYVLSGKPEGAHDSENVKSYYEKMQYLTDLSTVEEEDLEDMIYNTFNVIDTGRILGTAIEDFDAISSAVATVTANYIKGEDALKGLESDGKNILVPYTAYAN